MKILFIFLLWISSIEAQYDIVLKNGRVISTTADPKGPVLDQVLNVGISNGKIAALSAAPLQGREVVDCTGLVVAPGFVDIHYHGEAREAAQVYRVRDGITTSAETETGELNLDGHFQEMEKKGLIANHFASSSVASGYSFAISTRKIYKMVNAEGQVVDYVRQSPGRFLWYTIVPARYWDQPLGDSTENRSLDKSLASPSLKDGIATYPQCYNISDAEQTFTQMTPPIAFGNFSRLNEQEKIEALKMIEWGLQNGATSIGSLAGYNPFSFGDQLNSAKPVLTDLAKGVHDLAKAYNCPVVEHGIQVPFTLGLATTLEYVKKINGRYHYCHVVSTAGHTPEGDQSKQAVDLIEKLISDGYQISYEMYPWDAGSSPATAPYWADMITWKAQGVKPENVIEVFSKKSLVQLAKENNRSIEEEWNLWKKSPAKTIYILEWNKQDNLDYAFLQPHCCVMSDGITSFTGGGHPRRNGSFARFLRQYTRERKLLSLPDAIRKMTSLPLSVVASASEELQRKGQIAVGFDADITIFDPNKVAERASYENPQQFSVGIPHVLINGVFVVRNNENVKGALPGRIIYGKLKAKGRPPIVMPSVEELTCGTTAKNISLAEPGCCQHEESYCCP